MGFFDSIRDGWLLFLESFGVLVEKPVLLAPIFLCWIIIASLVLYLRYFFEAKSLFLAVIIIYLFVLAITFIICFSNLIMLELIQQIESGKKTSLIKAFFETISLDLLKMIPIALIWSLIWFIILIIKVLTRKSSSSEKAKPSARDAALTLGGANSGPASWLRLGLSMFEKLVRMTVFMTLPAIAWENKGPFSSFKQAVNVIRKHPIQFVTSYTLTGIAGIFMAMPLVFIFLMDKAGMEFPTIIWIIVIIYEGIVWTFSIYLEQMSVALLYMWHMKWEKKGGKGELSSIEKPSLLDKNYEFA